MNRDDILSFLASLLGNFVVYPNLAGELTEILARSGFEKQFFNLLLVRLKYLSEYGVSAILYPKAFESLSNNAEGMYSMRLSGNGFNVRILYAFLPDGSPALLLGFAERSGKRVSSYKPHIPVAQDRLKSIMEEYDHEKSE